MKSATILLSVFSAGYDACAMEAVVGHYTTYRHETKQRATYTIENGVAIITALEPLLGKVNLPLPLTVPVTDLGSGILVEVQVNADTKQALPAICPNQQWADLRQKQRAIPPIEQSMQLLYRDWNSL